jgi:hypothetical protein
MVRTSAEDGRVTVILVIAHVDLFKAYPRGVKVKICNCKQLTPSEKAKINQMMIVEASLKYDEAMENHPDPTVAEAHRIMNKRAKDPAHFIASLEARKSHPNFQAMVEQMGTEEERERFNKFVASAGSGDLQGMMSKLKWPAKKCDEPAVASTLQTGQRVVAVGLASQWLNGATCSVTSRLDPSTGRCIVRVHAPPDAVRRSKGFASLKPHNLESVAFSRPRVDPSSQWLDEYGWVCSKSIDYGVQCPKSHDLVAHDSCSAKSGVCSVCDDADAPDVWSCCGGCCYCVCAPCRKLFLQQRDTTLRHADVGADCSSDFPMLVCEHSGHQRSLMYVCVCACMCVLECSIMTLCVVQGIRLSALKSFKQRWQRVYTDMTTSQVSNFIIKPLTARSRCSLCEEMLRHPRSRDRIARANWFLSHTWQNKFADTVDSVLYFFKGKPEESSAVFWFDVFSAPQHQVQEVPKPPEWWMQTFKTAIESMGSLILVVDDWGNDPPSNIGRTLDCVRISKSCVSRILMKFRRGAGCPEARLVRQKLTELFFVICCHVALSYLMSFCSSLHSNKRPGAFSSCMPSFAESDAVVADLKWR